jgi:hypothetical protein
VPQQTLDGQTCQTELTLDRNKRQERGGHNYHIIYHAFRRVVWLLPIHHTPEQHRQRACPAETGKRCQQQHNSP